MSADDEAAPRGTPNSDGPWCWQSKRALARVREAFDGHEDVKVPTALATYLALSEIASDAGGHTFEATLLWLAGKSGVSERQLKRVLPELEKASLLRIQRRSDAHGMRRPSVFTLLSEAIATRSPAPTGQGGPTSGQGGPTSGQAVEIVPWPESEEREETKEQSEEERTLGSSSAVAFQQPVSLQIPLLLNTPKFAEVWGRWIEIRQRGKKLKTPWPELFAEQLRWLEELGSVEAAIESVSQSIRNGWQGLFEPKGQNLHRASHPRSSHITNEEHAKGFFHGTEFDTPPPPAH